MDRELKPCPMCGSDAELKETFYLESERPYSYVHCTNQQCDMHHHNTEHFSGPNPDKNSQAAAEAWNRLADMPRDRIAGRDNKSLNAFSLP
jgi:hypothetical protein